MKDYYESYWSDAGYRPEGQLIPALRQLFESQMPDAPNCLDVGCGDALRTGPWVKAHGGRYVGVDISESAIHRARANGFEARRIDDATALPFANGSFDVVVCSEVLEHLFAPHAVAVEIQRVLRPGGVVLITVPNVAYMRNRIWLMLGRWNPIGDSLSVEQSWRDPHIRFFTADSLRRMLHHTGFVDVIIGGYEGSMLRGLLGRLPRIGRRFHISQSSPLFQFFELRFPSLLSCRLYAIARKAEIA